MKRKWLIAAPILAVMIAILVLIVWISVVTGQYVQESGILDSVVINPVYAHQTEEQTFPASGIDTLILRNSNGSVEITGWDEESIQVTYTKTAHGKDDEQAQSRLGDMVVDITQTGGTLNIASMFFDEMNTIEFSGNSPQIAYTLYVPTRLLLEITNDSGSVRVVNCAGDARLSSPFGTVAVDEMMGGNLEITSSSGEVTLARSVDLSSASIVNEYGSITVSDSSMQTLSIEAKDSTTSLENVRVVDGITAKVEFGTLDLKRTNAAAMDLSMTNGDMTLVEVSGDLQLDSSYGNITIEDADEVKLNLDAGSGDILFEGSLGDGEHILKAEYGDITLRLPTNSNLNVDLQTQYGEIVTDFNLPDAEAENNKVTGEINGGGASLKVQTQNGNIYLSEMVN